ncbi:hypothetical protein EON06_10045 [Staphylococcus delphini]|uniref:hypothetical protein n=1 Tax=Staphylococcus delphini TaxID=53344 RepID=UPI0013628373|nr:hypothetical protein [Staphylococcus delphini]NBK48073.1 hypothetical protein [Staphylococcus delphini]
MEVIYFGVDTVEEYLKSFGLITKNKKNHLKILDAYPPLPDYIINKIIVEVNENSPLIIENWKVGKNKVKFINDDEYYIYLEEFSYPYYNYLKGKSVYTIQCLNFHQEIFIPNHYTSILLDLRCNFGGSITEMQNYYNKLIDIIKLQKIVEISLLVSNTTCSSAELFVEQMADSYNTLIN